MSTIEVLETTKDTIVGTGERFLSVSAQIVDGKKKIPVKRGYPLDTSAKEIQKDLKAHLANYEAENVQADQQAVKDKTEAAADKTIGALEGTTISN